MAGRLFIIVGAPGSGKSLLMYAIEHTKIPIYKNIKIITKISSRRKRSEEGSEIAPIETINNITLSSPKKDEIVNYVKDKKRSKYYNWDNHTNELTLFGPLPFEELQDLLRLINNNKEDKMNLFSLYNIANKLPEECDIIYEQYTKRYGCNSNDMVDVLHAFHTAIVIINDIKSIRELKAIFGDLAVVIFLYCPEPQDFEELGLERGDADKLQAQRRKEKKEVIIRRYMENIELFDHVIINTYDKRKRFQDIKDFSEISLIQQFNQITDKYIRMDKIKFKIKEGLYA